MPRVILLALLVATLTSCKKEKLADGPQAPAVEQSNAAVQQPPSPRGPAPLAPQPVTITASGNGDVNATLGQLSLELRKYVLRTKSAPKTFEEFAEKAQVQAPAPPAGKKYAIGKGVVVLVNR